MIATRQELVSRIEHLGQTATGLWVKLKIEHDLTIIGRHGSTLAAARKIHEETDPSCVVCAYLKQTGNL